MKKLFMFIAMAILSLLNFSAEAVTSTHRTLPAEIRQLQAQAFRLHVNHQVKLGQISDPVAAVVKYHYHEARKTGRPNRFFLASLERLKKNRRLDQKAASELQLAWKRELDQLRRFQT